MFDSQKIIDEFFVKDGEKTQFGTIRCSILLALVEDMKYCVQVPQKWTSLNLDSEQWKTMQYMMPSFTVVLQFCSAVDMLARVWRASKPKNGQNGSYFRNCLVRWFKTTPSIANKMWNFRNGMSHEYNLQNNSGLKQYGDSRFIVRNTPDHYTLYLHAMYTSTVKAKSLLYEYICKQPEGRKRSIARYLNEFGFIYIF